MPKRNHRITKSISKQLEMEQPMNEVFIVERILGKRINDGTVEYKIKWLGYDKPEDDTWETIDNCHCPLLIEEYEKEHAGEEPEQIIKSVTPIESGKRRRKRHASKSSSINLNPDDNEANNSIAGIPLVEKEDGTYHLQKMDTFIYKIMGMTRLEEYNRNILMALIMYSDEEVEYVPVDVLRQHEKGKEILMDFLLSKIQFV